VSASKLFLVDSSGWIEYFGGGPKADAFAPYFERDDRLVLPTIVIYEVQRKLEGANQDVASARFLSCAYRTQVLPLDINLAVAAAKVAVQTKLPMADAIIYATAREQGAELITMDTHFKGLPGVTLA